MTLEKMSMIEPNVVSSGYPETCQLQDEKILALSMTDNMDAVTFSIKDEDHTIGNALRWVIMKNPNVTFCGYSIPHPSEFKIHFRIQTDGIFNLIKIRINHSLPSSGQGTV